MTVWLLYAITVLVWGTTWMAIEYQLGVVSPEVSIFYRYVVASGLLFSWCTLRGLRLRFTVADHRRFLQLGLALFSLNYILTYYAQQYITSAVTAIAFSTMLWMNIVNSRLIFGTRIDGGVAAGSTLGIVGIVLLFLPELDAAAAAGATITGLLLAVAGAYSNAWGMLYGAVLTGITALAEGRGFALDTSGAYLGSLLYLAVFGSIVGFGSYLTLLGRVGAGRAGYAMVMFPVVAIVISVISGESSPRPEMFAGVGLVMAGNLLVLGARRRAAQRAEQQA